MPDASYDVVESIVRPRIEMAALREEDVVAERKLLRSGTGVQKNVAIGGALDAVALALSQDKPTIFLFVGTGDRHASVDYAHEVMLH